MRLFMMFLTLSLWITSIGLTQDETAAPGPAAGQPEVPAEATTEDASQVSPLGELEWMIGEWVDAGEDSKITTVCSWAEGEKFLKRSFTVTMNGEVKLKGTELIGWDPIEERIRSWTFDSEGGFGEGRWLRDGNQWLVKTSYVLASGERASALNVFTYVDQDTLQWQSIAREVGGELLPNIPEVTVVRQKADEDSSQQVEKKEVSQ